MIRYALKCDNGHLFDSWFQSAGAFDGLVARALVECPDCGSHAVAKAPMAPEVRSARKARAQTPAPAPDPDADRAAALAELRRQVEENSEYVGMNFAAEARAIHSGEAPERSIYGEARVGDARALIEDGVPVAPLPFRPTRKMN